MKVIEFLGMPRAGKTTQKMRVLKHLSRQGYRCNAVDRPPTSYREIGNLEDFHAFFFRSMREAYYRNVDKSVDFLFYDRGFYDRLALLSMDLQEGNISREFADSLRHSILEFLGFINFPFLFIISPEISLKRLPQQILDGLDNSPLLVGLPGVDNNLMSLRVMHTAYSGLAESHKNIILINGSPNIEEVYLSILADINY